MEYFAGQDKPRWQAVACRRAMANDLSARLVTFSALCKRYIPPDGKMGHSIPMNDSKRSAVGTAIVQYL